MRRAAVTLASEDVPPAVLGKIRVPFIQRARLTHEGGSEAVFLVDLGLAGVFAERSEPLPVGARVELAFELPGNALAVEAGCRVAWWLPAGGRLVTKSLPAGVGLEFVDLSERDRGRVRQYLEDYLRRDPGLRRFHRSRPLTDQEGGEP